MRINGQFQFLHTINTAWILDCSRIARESTEELVLCLTPGEMVPADELSWFLQSFRFVDRIEQGARTSAPYVPPHPSASVAESILAQWYEEKINRNVFRRIDNFLPLLHAIRAEGSSIVTTNGCFDILHPGHVRLLQSASALADHLVVLINSDESVRRFKGQTRPVHDWRFRSSLLTQLDAVSHVVIFDEDTPLDKLSLIRPDHHVKGGSFISERLESERALLNNWGGHLHSLPMTGAYSTTAILDRYPSPPFPI